MKTFSKVRDLVLYSKEEQEDFIKIYQMLSFCVKFTLIIKGIRISNYKYLSTLLYYLNLEKTHNKKEDVLLNISIIQKYVERCENSFYSTSIISIETTYEFLEALKLFSR